jgi:hypothetical protein
VHGDHRHRRIEAVVVDGNRSATASIAGTRFVGRCARITADGSTANTIRSSGS